MNWVGASESLLNSIFTESGESSGSVTIASNAPPGSMGNSLRAFEKSSAAPGSRADDSETGRSSEKDFFSLMQDVWQICQVALAPKEKVSPGESEEGGVISIRKIGVPE